MLGVNDLIVKLNNLISAGSLSELEVTQLSKVIDTLEKRGVSSVNTPSDLPNPVINKGRFFWIESEKRYVLSNGINWDINNILVIPEVNLYAWGTNSSFALGNGSTTTTNTSTSSPISIAGNFTDWIQVETGNNHSAALRANGTVWAWGYASQGQIGDGFRINRTSPVAVLGEFTDFIQVTAGFNSAGGVRADGTIWGWGDNQRGNLGDGTITSRSSPVSVVGGFTDWIQVAAGFRHRAAVRANGTAWAWGYNNRGQLGDDTVGFGQSKSSPVSVVGGFTDWIQVSAGGSSNIGLRANGTLWGWGSNDVGKLGDGTITSRSSPVSVVGGFTDWIQISVGNYHSLALRANGTAWAWGNNIGGELGDGFQGTSYRRSSPVSVVGGFTDWIQVGAGNSDSIGLRSNGTAWKWGSGSSGKIGDGTTTNRSSPVSVAGGFTDWVYVVTGPGNSSFGIRG